jgi:hypothetical protein
MKANVIVPASFLPAIAQPQLPQSQVTLKNVAGEFLDERAALESSKNFYWLEYSLRDLVSGYGHLAIGNVTSGMIQQALHARNLTADTTKWILSGIKGFFWWSRDNAYLPPGPTAADSIQIQIQVPLQRSPIVRPIELRMILAAESPVGLKVALTMWSFAGLGFKQSARAQWENVVPGRAILLKPKAGVRLANTVPIRRVLDAWLRPFYGCSGPLLCVRSLQPRTRLHGRMLGVRCHSCILRRSFHAYSAALSGQVIAGWYQRHAVQPTVGDAREYFSLTPERVGLKNWPEMVAAYLAELESRRAI